MAAPSNTAIQYAPTTSMIYLNSLDRYSNGVPPPASSNQTTATDITYSVPGLANMATVQTLTISPSSSWWSQVASNPFSAAFYTNIINLVDYTAGKTYLVTIPPGVQSTQTLITNLPNYVKASGFGGTASASASININASSSSSAPYDPISTPTNYWWYWYDLRVPASPNSLGWSRVTTAPDGTNISNRRQLFDLLGLAGHVPSVAGVAGVQGSGYTTSVYAVLPATINTCPIRYIDVISPQITPFASDVNSYSNSSSNAIARLTGTGFLTNTTGFNSGATGKVLKVVPGSTSLRIQLVDDQQNPIPTNFPVPIPYVGALPTGTGATSTTLSNLTLSNISSASTTFPAGTQVNILTLTNAPTGWFPGVFQVQSSTSNTVTIPYTTTSSNQINSSNFTFTIGPVWLTTKAGNQCGPEYVLIMNGIPRTTTG